MPALKIENAALKRWDIAGQLEMLAVLKLV